MKHKKQKPLDDLKVIDSQQLLLVEVSGDSDGYQGRDFCAPDGLLVICCYAGGFSLKINGSQVECQANHFMGITPGQTFTLESVTPDMRCTLLIIPNDCIACLKQQVDMSYIFGMFCSEVFCAPRRVVVESTPIFDLIRLLGEQEGNVWRFTDLHRRTLALAFIDVLTVIINCIAESATHSARDRNSLTRQEVIARQFFANVIRYHKQNHSVDFYAQLAGLSPKYLSTTIRLATNRTAQEWIALLVIFSAKRMLSSSVYTVAEVAASLNYASTSTFIRFFKANTGITPLAFRK